MNDIGVFTPEQARQLWQDYLSRKQKQPHVQANYPQRRPIDEVSPHRVFVRNDSGETIPRYGCMQVTGTVTTGGKTFVTVTKPTTTDGEYLFNSQFSIASAEYGWAYRFGVVVMLGDGTAPTAAGVEYVPVVGAWSITESSGPFVVFGEHNAASDAVIGRIGGSGGGDHSLWGTVDEVVCDPYGDPLETYCWVLVTDFSGGCTTPIPGEDDVTGLVQVFQKCDLFTEYYTAEQLVGKTIEAGYYYPRTGTCEGRWLVRQICGTPECA